MGDQTVGAGRVAIRATQSGLPVGTEVGTVLFRSKATSRTTQSPPDPSVSLPLSSMIVTVVGELERTLIAERVRAGIRNARAKGKTLGRPRVKANSAEIARMRSEGRSIKSIAEQLGVSVGTVCAREKLVA